MMTKPPLTYDLFPKVKEALNVQDLLDLIDPTGSGDELIHVLESNFREPTAPSTSSWTRVIIMGRTNAFSTPDFEDGAISVQPQIRVDHFPPENIDSEYNINAFMQVVHGQIFTLLQGKMFTLEKATMSMPLMRVERPISPIQSDEGFYFNNSIFKTILTSYE